MRRPVRWLLISVGLLIVLSIVLAVTIRALTYEQYTGYFGPAWTAEGRTVLFIERQTRGVTWGLGWEHFTPPANTFVLSDVIRLRELEIATGRVRTLETIENSPLVGRITSHYRNRIFGYAAAAVDASADTARFSVGMSIPRQPQSEQFAILGTWPRREGASVRWENATVRPGGVSRPVLSGDREVMAVPGREAFPSAILAVNPDTTYTVLASNDVFERVYPQGVPVARIQERARRAQILRTREFTETVEELKRELLAQGLTEVQAELGAYDRMQELGYLPRDPVIVARRVNDVPPNIIVFDIPSEYFRAGLFRDIAAAVAVPGDSVKTSAGDYFKYYDDDVGPSLRAYRSSSDTFYCRVDDELYVFKVTRYPRTTTR